MAFAGRGNFNDNRRQGFDHRGGSRGFNRPQQTMYDAVCAKCGVDCQVPFRPSANRDVFCSKCFEGSGNDSRSTGDPRSFSDRQMYDAVCGNCGQNCQVPFQPKSGQTVFCSNCFSKKVEGGRPDTGPRPSNTIDLKELNAKLDKIISLLTPAAPVLKVKPAKKKDLSVEPQPEVL